MPAKVDVVNRALGFLGERAITNPDLPETPAGRKIVQNYDDCRREVIRRYPWNFAEVWVEVNRTTAPPFGYDDAYALPSDFLRLLFVGDARVTDSRNRDYRLLNQGSPNYRRVIALDNGGETTLQIGYSADVELLSQWDPLALKVLAYWLALDSAKGITGQDGHVQMLNSLLTEELKDAVGVDGQEQSIRQHVFSNVQNVRDLAEIGVTPWTNVEGFY